MTLIFRKNSKKIWLFVQFILSLQPKKSIRGAEACAKAEKIPIEPDAGNAVGGKKYESKYKQQTTRNASRKSAGACRPIVVATKWCGNSHR